MTNINSLNQSAPPSSTDGEIDVGILLSQFRRFKWLLAFMALLGMILGAIMYVTSTRTYTASTTLMVNLEGEAAAAQTADIVASLTGSTKNAIAPAFAFATSAKLLENVSIKEGLVDDGEFNNKLRDPTMRAKIFETLRPAIAQFKNLVGAEPPAIAEEPAWATQAVLDERRAVRALKRRVIVTDLKDELQLRISVTTEEPEKSARLANTMATMLNASMLDTKTDALDNARDWIKEEAERVEGSIREIEDEINEEIVAGNAIAATETLGSNTERLLESELLLEANALRTEALLRLSDVIDLMQDNVDAQTAFATLPEDLRNELIIDYAPIFLWERRDGPPTRAELLTAERQIERDQENQVAATNRLLQEVLPVQAYTRKLSTAQNRFRQLQAKYVAGQELLGKLRESEAELQIQREGEVRRLTVMETAKPPLTHTSPALLPLLVVGAFAGLLLGIAIMLIKFFRRDAFTSLEDVEQTFGAPTVAVISDFRKGLRKKFAWKMLSTEIAEAYRRAYSAIFVVRSEENPHALMVTSSIPSEGKTTTSIYIAAAAAEEGRSTLLIDLDFRKRSVTRYLEVEHEFGVYSVFRGERSVKDAVMAYEPGNFDILTTDGRTRTGTIGEDGEELSRETLSAVKVQQLIKDAKDHYDVVVVDVPPILAVQDANMIGRMVDSTIFVVATQTLKKKAAKRAMTEWKRGEQDLFGLIVRGEKSELHEYYGYDYYHYNYATKEDDRPRRTTSRRRKRRTSTDAKKASGQRD